MENPEIDFSLVFEKLEEAKVEMTQATGLETLDFEIIDESILELKEIQETISQEEDLMIFTTA